MNYLLGVCPCGLKLESAGIEPRLRAHVAREHPDAGVEIKSVVETVGDWEATMYEAWLSVSHGVPVLVTER